ncbi:MAG: DEAD/DEAH box helicase, partial [Verrucomicrobiales bacterium]|nr:DEAD/DEAH box helicase [Verrucomicrobiales bacterium]
GSEVSIVLQQSHSGEWRLDGRSTGDAKPNNEHVVALLIEAIREKCGESAAKSNLAALTVDVSLECHNVRSGTLFYDEPDARAVIENLRVARTGSEDPRVLEALAGFGLKRISRIYPAAEIVPDFHGAFAFPGQTVAEQEIFWADLLANRLDELRVLGCEVQVDDSLGLQIIDPTDFYGELTGEDEATDWFDFEYGIRVGAARVNLLPCLVPYLESQPASFSLESLQNSPKKKVPIRMDDSGRYVAVPAKKLHEILGILTELFGNDAIDSEGHLRLHKIRAAQLTTIHRDGAAPRMVDQAPNYLLKSADELETLKPTTHHDVPQGFLATLRPYQQDGFEWLQFLREQGLGGILADDMGLGKTIQTLCHLHAEKAAGRANLPTLILAPKSVVPNWEKEAKKFAPSLKVLALQGPQRKKYYSVLGHADLVITSYPVLLRDAEEIHQQPFHYVILDEAHTIKNARSKVTQVAYKIDARHRLCLTGTPIENHLGELWSQFHFLMPGFLGSEDGFNRCYRKPIEKFRDESRRIRLAERVAPLLLRRTKTRVAKDLPPKTEIVRTIELTPKQVDLYEAVRASVSRELRDEINRRGFEASKILVLDALMKLRQICCHPKLLKLPTAQRARNSAKLDLLMDLLPAMVEEGRRVLIFSQFTQMLALIEQALDKEKIRYQTLTGQSKNRGKLCDDFQDGKVPVFLISLRAGGTGLNLTKADTVIHYDPWWNPALEAQATDRAYRIGQKNPVFVYKLICQGTIEEKILQLQQKKRALFEGVLEGAPQKLEFSEKDLDDLLAPIS